MILLPTSRPFAAQQAGHLLRQANSLLVQRWLDLGTIMRADNAVEPMDKQRIVDFIRPQSQGRAGKCAEKGRACMHT